MNEPTHLDLFSGIGGFALAAQWAGFRTIGFCEIDGYCRKVLAKNFGAIPYTEIERCGQGRTRRPNSDGEGKSEPPFLIPDIADFSAIGVRCDLITGGFPCQPFSVAGKRRGAADDRAIWPEMFRIISEARPAWVLGENVSGIIPMELDNVLSDLEGIGYATRAFVIPACAVDARHRRDRVWIIGRNVSNSECDFKPESEIGTLRPSIPDSQHSATARQRQHCGNGLSESEPVRSSPCCWDDEREWSIKSGMGRVAHGIPSRVDRLKGLGNAIVPAVAYEILREIRKLC